MNLKERVQTTEWYNFYKTRVNNTYQDYFEERYKPMINTIIGLNPKIVREEGIGIGSISKALRKHNIDCYGFDKCPLMVDLANTNNGGVQIANRDCIFSHVSTGIADVVVTHGVLEHFTDYKIAKIIARYKEERVRSIHYVPTNKYLIPSFGDERLLPYQHWVSLVEPKDYFLFNNEQDLLLII